MKKPPDFLPVEPGPMYPGISPPAKNYNRLYGPQTGGKTVVHIPMVMFLHDGDKYIYGLILIK